MEEEEVGTLSVEPKLSFVVDELLTRWSNVEFASQRCEPTLEYPGYISVWVKDPTVHAVELVFGYEDGKLLGSVGSPLYDQRGWDSGPQALDTVEQVADLVVAAAKEFSEGRWTT